MPESLITKSHRSPAGIREDEDIVQRRTLRDYYIMLRERVWIALPVALLISLSYGYWKSRETPMYMSAATMQFEKPETIVTAQGVVDPAIHSDIDINTYIQQLGSNKLRAKVIASFTPEEQRILLRPALKHLLPGQPPPPVSSMLGSVDPEPIPKSYLIRIGVSHQDPEAAALIANRYIKEFMQQLADDVSGANDFAVTFLSERVETLREESEAAQGKLNKYMTDHHLVSLDKTIDMISDGLRTVSGNLTTAKLDLLSLENVSQQIETFRHGDRDLMEISYIAGHGAVPHLRSELAALQQEQAALSGRYFERHPKMIELAQRIQISKSMLDKEIDGAIQDLHTAVTAKTQNVQSLEAEYESRQKQELDLKAMSVDYDSLKSQADAARSNYASTLERLNQTKTTKNLNLEKIPLHPLDAASPNYAPYKPNISGIVRTSVGLGILTFVGIAVGLSFIDDRIKSAWDIESFIGVNLLGIIPDLGHLKLEDRYTMLADGNSSSPGIEPILGIYSSIKIHSKLDFPKSLLVTSTIPGEGKTLVSANLAACFARHGKRTLLVDCDLRRPMLHRHFRQENTSGIIAWTESGASLEGDLMTNPHLGIVPVAENLSVLTSGGRSKSPTGILESPVFGQLIERLKGYYDLIIVDSPPMGAVTDALLIAQSVDEVIYVCRFNRAYRKHIRLFIRTLVDGKNTVLGIVLNGLSPRRIAYYSNYRYYRSYKKYYGSQT